MKKVIDTLIGGTVTALAVAGVCLPLWFIICFARYYMQQGGML